MNKINIKHGGSQPVMRDSDPLTQEMFGPYHTQDYPLQPGGIQKMQFDQSDPGPCYMTNAERRERMYDVDTGQTCKRELTKASLIKSLKDTGLKDPCGSKEKLQELALSRNLPMKYQKKVIKEGWAGKQKGSLQILFKQGWINPLCVDEYTAKGKEVSGRVELSINELMKEQIDFVNKITLLQYHAGLMGVTIERSPKCHPEIAGEGVEYGWALSKMHYRRSPTMKKKGKESFLKLVRECTNNSTVLNIERMRACSRRARQYMLLYKAVESLNLNESDGIVGDGILNKHSILEGSIKLYRRLQKTKKCHRSVMDNQLFDVRKLEEECPLSANEDSKENLIRAVVGKMVTL